jgi:hypothetical protein
MRTGHSATIAPCHATNPSSEITSTSALFRRRIRLLSSLRIAVYSWTAKSIIFALKVVLWKHPIRALVGLLWYSSFHHDECQNCIGMETTDNSFQIYIYVFKPWWLLYSRPNLILKNSTFCHRVYSVHCAVWIQTLYILPEFKLNLWRFNHN